MPHDENSSVSSHPADDLADQRPSSLTISTGQSLGPPELLSYKVHFTHHDQDQEWTIWSYRQWASALENNQGQLKEEVISKLKRWAMRSNTAPVKNNFRQQLYLQGIPVLVAIFEGEQEIRLASARLGSELFLLHSMTPPDLQAIHSLGPRHWERYRKLEAHAEKIASLRSADFPSIWELVAGVYDNPTLEGEEFNELDSYVQTLIFKLVGFINEYKSAPFEKLTDFGLGLTAQFALLRVHMLKFLAILPSLSHDKSGAEVKRLLLESLRRLSQDSQKAREQGKKGQSRPIPEWLEYSVDMLFALFSLLPARPVSALIRWSVRLMAKRFIAGETIELASSALSGLKQSGRDATLDQLGELVVSEAEADHYTSEVLKLIKGLGQHVKKGERNAAGINKAHVSIKVSALCSDFRPMAFEHTYRKVAPRLIEILTCAKEHEVFINIDAEHYHYRDLVFEIYKKSLLETPHLADYKDTGIVIQAYLRDAKEHLEQVMALARRRGHIMPVRLVKGAYWDAETVEAEASSFEAPEFLNKEETDLHFRQMIIVILQNHETLQLCIASHNFADHALCEAIREKLYPKASVIEHQCLHMTYEALSRALSKMNWPTRNYIPVGGLLEGMAYLVRRIMENSSQVGVLTIMRSHKKQAALVNPLDLHKEKKNNRRLFRDPTTAYMTASFFNVAPIRTYLHGHELWVKETFEEFEKNLGQSYDGSFELIGKKCSVYSPSNPELLVGSLNFASADDANRAVDELDSFYNQGPWSRASSPMRASVLVKASLIMTAKRLELAALITYESGKILNEALADVDEAIDFLNFYAREEIRLNKKEHEIMGRGVVAVICPWNFPLAIPTGMCAAALVAGNTVALKSAEQTPLIAQKLVDIFHQAKVPRSALIHLPGLGEEVGAALVAHHRIAQVVFTGSKAVGQMLASQLASRTVRNQLYGVDLPVRLIAEMGGKNAVIVTANAELDETVAGIMASALWHAGQKCSALSRIIVHHSVKEKLAQRLKSAFMDLKVGPSWDFSTAVNPVITKEDQERLRMNAKEAIAEALQWGGQVIVDRTQEDLPGFCVGPCLIEVPRSESDAQDSYWHKELFGPIIHLMEFRELSEAVEIFNGTNYALTGGLFAQSQDDIDYCLKKLEAGNLYINRNITGARVAIEPFGGFKLSGTGPKAGGKQYLHAFHHYNANLPLQKDLTRPTPTPSSERSGLELESQGLARASGLSLRGRLERMIQGLEYVLKDFEALYQGIYGENKKLLKKFKRWLEEDLESYQMGRHTNRFIPGQISYNDYQMVTEHFLIVAHEERAYFSTLLSCLCALSLGTGVTILARNQRALEWWLSLQLHFKEAGISSENFDVRFASEEEVEYLIHNNPKLEVIAVDGPLNFFSQVSATVAKAPTVVMKKMLCPFDSPSIRNIKAHSWPFIHIRSMAINTMRHGAPLDLEN